jgi:hypothetical protein
MSELVTKIDLDDLNTIRVICQNKDCGAIIEGGLDRIHRLLAQSHCPMCSTSFKQGIDSPINQLAHAITTLSNMGDRVCIEFVVPAVQK